MTEIRSIVVATDFSAGSDAAVERAVQLAATHGASLCLLHALDDGASHGSKGAKASRRAAGDMPADARLRQHLADSAALLAEQTGLTVETHDASGQPAKVIEAHVRASACSLLVVGSRADPATSGLGSTALEVVESPTCPVLVVRALGSGPYARVLSAVDMREGSVRAVHFALALFPAARHHLLYALDPGQESVPNGDVQDEDRLRRMNESRYSRAEQALQQLALRLSALALHPVRADVADDEPARAILVGAADLPADCVVVGHHGQGVATDRFLGSMARHVIHSAISDVLVVP